jgi:integrase
VKIVGRVKNAGKLRQADKLRSYIRTAFTKAINARGDVNAPEKLRSLDVQVNPARDMTIVHGSNNTRDRVLSLRELHHYWQRVKQEPEPARSLLMLHVLTGGQRQVQLARVTLNDIDRDAPSMTLLDFKGRRAVPRIHEVPLLPEALDAIDRITGSGQFVFSANGGKTPIGGKYILDRVKKIVLDMETAGELEKGRFTAGTIRATIETRLSAKPYRVQSDVLAQLLSHGLGGVQARHYQRHDFFEEKLEALEMLYSLLSVKPHTP